MMLSRLLLLVVLSHVFAACGAADDASTSPTLVSRRVLESEPGFASKVAALSSYELHDLSVTLKRRVLRQDRRLSMPLEVLGRRMTLELEPNDELFAPGYQHQYLDEKGQVERVESDLKHCMFKGKVAGEPESSVTASTCEGVLHATVFAQNAEESFSVVPLEDVTDHAEHVVYRHRDLIPQETKCGLDDSTQRQEVDHNLAVQRKFEEINHRRALTGADRHDDHHHEHDHVHETNERQSRDLWSTVKYVGVTIVNDNTRYKQKAQFTHLHSASLFATVVQLYAKLGPSGVQTCNFEFVMQISSMLTFSKQDPYSVTLTDNKVLANDLLNAFEGWRDTVNGVLPAQNNVAVNGHDIAHLLSGIKFQSTTIGLAHVNGVCNLNSRSGITQANTIPDSQVASTITHEIGHNMGISHTDVSAPGVGTCPDVSGKKFIMAASSSGANTDWEGCSAAWLNEANKPTSSVYGTGSYSACMEATTNPLWNFTAPVCGDGIVEGDEECDCINNNCVGVDSCCNGATCKYALPAVCSPIHDECCTASCQIETDTTKVCRSANGSPCDVSEKCTGTNKKCPSDWFNSTGTPCTTSLGTTTGTCYFKKCLDVKDQCLAQPASFAWVDVCNGVRNDNTCGMRCKTSGGSCQQYVGVTVNWADGTKCNTGKGCYKGNCIPFASIPIPNCTVANVSDISSIDCGSGDAGSFADAGGNSLTDVLNSIWEWMKNNLYIWIPCVAVAVLLLLFCCCVPRGGNPPIARQGVQKMGNSFRGYTNRNDVPVAYKA